MGASNEDAAGFDKYYGWGRIDALVSLQAAGGTNLFSQVAIGGGFATVFTFLNTGSTSVTGNLILTAEDGNPLDATLSAPSVVPKLSDEGDRVLASSLSITVPPGGARFMTATSPNPSDPNVRSGWARMETAGGVLGGVATFQFTSGGVLRTIAGVISSDAVPYATIPIDNDDSQLRFTGYAVANQGKDNINIKIVLVNQDGTVAETASPALLNPLGPGKKIARFLHQDLPARVRFRGSMVLISQDGKKFAVVALVQNQGLFTAIPVIPAKAPHIN